MHPEGSVLIETGDTKVICTASVTAGVPPFREVETQGWLTAEYAMLPRSTNTRGHREAVTGKRNGRSAEISRMIGRALRSCVDMSLFPGWTVTIDCDVIQADGGTRTASVTGGCVALADAFQWMLEQDIITENPLREMVAAISVGIVDGETVVDLCYEEDARAHVDMTVVMSESGKLVEIQGTGEQAPFTFEQMMEMLEMAKIAICDLFHLQKKTLIRE